MIECMTYRNYGHFEGDAQTYKTKDEKTEHLEEKDAIQGFKNYLLKETDANKLSDIEQRVSESIEKAVSFSEKSPYPKESELLTDVYVSYEKGECEMARVISMSDAINEAMKLAMRKDDNVLVIGEDVAGERRSITCKMMKHGAVYWGSQRGSYRNSAEAGCWTHRFLRRATWVRPWLRHPRG